MWTRNRHCRSYEKFRSAFNFLSAERAGVELSVLSFYDFINESALEPRIVDLPCQFHDLIGDRINLLFRGSLFPLMVTFSFSHGHASFRF